MAWYILTLADFILLFLVVSLKYFTLNLIPKAPKKVLLYYFAIYYVILVHLIRISLPSNTGSADFPGWYDGKSAYPYQAY